MSNRIAILDLGTNTFHLLIIEVQLNHQFNILFKMEKFVKLAEEGINRIGEKAFARGIGQLKEYRQVINQYEPGKVFAYGTAALRNAVNAPDFIKQALNETGIQIKVISGEEEATLIYKGVRKAVKLSEQPALIMDIGGGSTEFIIANKDEIFWKHSFSLGVSVLKTRFHHTEPISADEKNNLTQFLEQELASLFEQAKKYIIQQLVGASGSFDSYASLIACKYYSPEILDGKTSFEMKREEINYIFTALENATLEQRLQMPGLLAFRAEMIVVAAILTDVVVKHLQVAKIFQSSYALKEGLMEEVM